MKYQTATTEQRAGAVNPDGTPAAPPPPDDSGDWQLVGLHPFMRAQTPPEPDPFGVASATVEWFVHFYWQRTYAPSDRKPKPAPTPMPGRGRACLRP